MNTKTLIGTLLTFGALLCPAFSRAQEQTPTPVQEPSNLPDEYLKNLKNYEFVNTRGMKDLTPNRHSWLSSSHDDQDNWELPTDEEIKKLKEMGITFPDFSFITGTDTVAPGQKRQRTHTIEHLLYALPGDALSLYPYYGLEEMAIYKSQTETSIESTKGFLETFSHWYDYRNGGRVVHQSGNKSYDLLDFPSCRDYIQISDDHGFYGGIYMSPGIKDINTAKTYEVGTAQEYIDAVKAINDDGGKGNIILTANLDFSGKTDVPMLGDKDNGHFSGVFNGNGYKISNLTIDKDFGEVGLIRYAASGATIANLVIDNTCTIKGSYVVGMVGKFDGGSLTVRNVTVNATIMGKREGLEDKDDHCAGAILGLGGADNTDNKLTFENIYVGGTIGNKDKNTKNKHNAVLCGWLANGGTTSTSTFDNIVFTGTLYGFEEIKGAWFIRRVCHEKFKWENCYKDGDTYVEKHDDYSLRFTNCYGNMKTADGGNPNGLDEPAWKAVSEYTSFEGWTDSSTPPTTKIDIYGIRILDNKNHRPWDGESKDMNDESQKRRKAGTSAVFYFPNNGTVGKEFLSDRSEYVIAADFSQTFSPESSLDVSEMKIKEPLIAFRHIFRIRDGRTQAAELRNNNREYIRRHQHKVTARVGANFQMRLDFPLPTNWGKSGGVTNYYYEKTKDSYDRVKQFGLRVLDGDTRQFKYDLGDGLPNNDDKFELGANIRMRRATASGNKEYAEAIDGMFEYHSMLMKPKVENEAHYIVQVIAKDDDGNYLKTSNDEDMVLMEYDITFLPEEGASLLTEDQLYSSDNKFRHARDEYMKDKYGEPVDHIDFDNYFAINKLEGNDALKKKMTSFAVIEHTEADGLYKDFPVFNGYSEYQGKGGKKFHAFYKWPLAWNRSGYAFGYNYRYDYNMYMLASHSENVPYHAKADEWNSNNPGDGNGLYDRLYYKTKRLRISNPSIKQEQGYFYYVNAASDPGVSARLNFTIPCPGSRVIVSAWVAEMSPADAYHDEPANLSFNFVAVMNGTNERITLHNFITGYIGEKNLYTGNLDKGDQLGKWLNVYYSFVPRLAEFDTKNIKFEDVNHFELELAHNGRSSAGSDYAIDDIRAYVVPPFSEADHDGYACEDSPLDINVSTSFDTLLEKSGEVEAFEGDETKDVSLYFAFVDKEIVDESGDLEKAFVKAFVSGDEMLPYGKVTFSNYYRGNVSYKIASTSENGLVNNTAYTSSAESGDRMIKFVTTVAPATLHLGKEYYVVFKSSVSDTPDEDGLAAFFDIAGTCSYNCSMIVRPSLKIKVDGVIQPEFDNISVCENQSPVIQVNVWSTDKDPVEVVKNAYFDWFDGSINDFENYRFINYDTSKEIAYDEYTGTDAKTLKKALEVFRFRYSEAETVAGISPETTEGADEEKLEQWMLDIIAIAAAPEASGRQRLWLHQSSFVLPPVDIADNTSKTKAKVVAIPITDLYPKGDHTSVCPSPTEVGVHIANRTPILMHGLNGITYPESLADVPLRVGIDQLRKGDDASLAFTKKILDMPVRYAASSDGEERTFSRVTEKVLNDVGVEEPFEGALLLAQTNDPEYRNLGTVDEHNQETEHLLWVGEIEKLVAASHTGAATGREYFRAKFAKDFHFKEGYFYRFRFRFEEKHEEQMDADDEVVCQGQDVFTIKVVPEYMQWTGDMNLSWDNDENWRRVASSEILKTNAAEGNLSFTDGASANRRGYAPLPFTKTLISAPVVTTVEENKVVTGENPWLYGPKEGNKKVDDSYSAPEKHEWTPDPTPTGNNVSDRIGNPTSLIQFDMTGFVADANTADEELRCKPWTATNCDQIHFLPGATIMNQQHLNYFRAWVDVELDHSRWYLLSSPLQDTYAGDFYLPTFKARQETELFREITYNEDLNNRFAPAVYQRGWDKGEARVYEFGETDARNAAVKTFWSHAYNDVTENYGGGNAFSIKTDVSKAQDAADKVLFRLPKADKRYSYYDTEGNSGNHHDNDLDKENAYTLNDTEGTLTSVTANAGKYFLVGNPFMTHFDIASFLSESENAKKVEQKYWIVTENGLIAGSVSEAGTFVASPWLDDDMPADATAVAPMQGFFVEAKEAATSLSLSYDEGMMRRYDIDTNVLTETTRAAAPATLKIVALNDGKPSSAALLVAANGESNSGAEAFDLRDLGIRSTVFTARAGHARSIDFSSNPEGTEIGVIADEETETTLLFEGAENFDGLFLIDRADRSATPLPDVAELKVKGAVSGRFYISGNIAGRIEGDTMEWTVEGNRLTVTDNSETGTLNVTVFDLLGCPLDSDSSVSGKAAVTLAKGVSIVRMSNGNYEKTIKINL